MTLGERCALKWLFVLQSTVDGELLWQLIWRSLRLHSLRISICGLRILYMCINSAGVKNVNNACLLFRT